jgi:hypothetical protein
MMITNDNREKKFNEGAKSGTYYHRHFLYKTYTYVINDYGKRMLEANVQNN